MNFSLNKTVFFIFVISFSLNVSAVMTTSSSSGMSFQQGNEIIDKLSRTLSTLKSWADDNTSKANRLEKYYIKENTREEDNYLYKNKAAWKDVKELNQNSMLLLEASYAFAKNTESAASFSEDAVRSRAWSECLNSRDCNFKKLNQMLDKEAISLSSDTKNNAIKTQKALLDSIDKLNEFSLQSEDSVGLNDSIDALSKVSATQANALVQLTSQISNLNRINAHDIQKKIEKEKLSNKADELFLLNENKTKSKHFKVSM